LLCVLPLSGCWGWLLVVLLLTAVRLPFRSPEGSAWFAAVVPYWPRDAHWSLTGPRPNAEWHSTRLHASPCLGDATTDRQQLHLISLAIKAPGAYGEQQELHILTAHNKVAVSHTLHCGALLQTHLQGQLIWQGMPHSNDFCECRVQPAITSFQQADP